MTTGNDLDIALSMGYFRTQQQVFTCRYIMFDSTVHTAHWLRIVLSKVAYGKTQRQLLKRNERFQVTVAPLLLTDELTDLYARYRRSLTFDAPDSIEDCLFGDFTYNVFDTQVISVRDGDRLVAAGIFDQGGESIAGIMNFFDPDYRRYSLGKYLMLLKTNYARQQNRRYYYPGYVISNYPKFDYKLFVCEPATELFDDDNDRWIPFSWSKLNELSAEMLTQRE